MGELPSGASTWYPIFAMPKGVCQATVVAVEEVAFLLTVESRVGGIEVQNDDSWWRSMCRQKCIYEELIDIILHVHDLAIASLRV